MASAETTVSTWLAAPTASMSNSTMNTTPLENSLSDLTIGLTVSLFALPLAIVILRLYVRINIVRCLESSDLYAVVALVLAGINLIALIFHCKDQMETSAVMVKATWVLYLTYWPAVWAVEMSILSWSLQVFRMLGSKHAKILIWSVMGLISVHTIAAVLVTLFSCSPISNLWDADANMKGCINVPAMQMALASITTFFNGIVFLVACLSSLRTELTLRNKVYLVGILKLGFVAFLAAVGRVISQSLLLKHDAAHHPALWILLPLFSAAQVDLGIVAASLPSLNPLLASNREASRSRKPSNSYIDQLYSRDPSRQGRRSDSPEKTQYKSIVVERDYSVKTETTTPAQSRRNSFSRSHAVMDLEMAATTNHPSTRPVSDMEISEIPREAPITDQSPEEQAVQSRIRAARLLGLKEEEHKYLSILVPKRWSRMSQKNRQSIRTSTIEPGSNDKE